MFLMMPYLLNHLYFIERMFCGGVILCFSMLVTFQPPFFVRLPFNPYFLHLFPWFLLQSIFLPSSTIYCFARGAQMSGDGGGSHWWCRIVHVIFAQNYSCV